MTTFAVNRVVIIARLTRDPELRSTASGVSVCNLRVACNTRRRDESGEWADRPNYFDVSVFGAAADSVHTYTRRGSRVAVDGRLEWREWETSEQQRRQAVSIVADTIQFLDAAERSRGDGEHGEGGEDAFELAGVGAEELAH